MTDLDVTYSSPGLLRPVGTFTPTPLPTVDLGPTLRLLGSREEREVVARAVAQGPALWLGPQRVPS